MEEEIEDESAIVLMPVPFPKKAEEEKIILAKNDGEKKDKESVKEALDIKDKYEKTSNQEVSMN